MYSLMVQGDELSSAVTARLTLTDSNSHPPPSPSRPRPAEASAHPVTCVLVNCVEPQCHPGPWSSARWLIRTLWASLGHTDQPSVPGQGQPSLAWAVTRMGRQGQQAESTTKSGCGCSGVGRGALTPATHSQHSGVGDGHRHPPCDHPAAVTHGSPCGRCLSRQPPDQPSPQVSAQGLG